MEHQVDYSRAIALIRKVAGAQNQDEQAKDLPGLIGLIKDLPETIKLLEDGFLPLLSTTDLDDVSLMDDLMDLGRSASLLLKDLLREGFDGDGADFNDKQLLSRYTQVSGLHKSAAEVSDSQLSAAKSLTPIISVLKVLSRNYDRGLRKLEAAISSAEKGTETEAMARGALGYFYSSYDRMLRGPLGLRAVLSAVVLHVRKHEQEASAHAGVQQIQDIRSSVIKAFDEAREALGANPDKITAMMEVKDGVWARTVALLTPLGLSLSGKYTPAGEQLSKAAAASVSLNELLPKVEAFQGEMLQVLDSARDAIRKAAPRSNDIAKRLPGLYSRVLGDLTSSLADRHDSSGFQKEEGADIELAATMESLIGEEKRLQKIFTTFQGRAEKFGPSEVKNLAAKSSKWRKDLESRLAEYGLKPNGTVTSDVISKLAFVTEDDHGAISTGSEPRAGLSTDLDGILSDLAAYWKGYTTLLRSGHDDAARVAVGLREAVAGTDNDCLGRHVHRYAQYLKSLVESGAKPTMSGTLPGAAMHMTGIISSRIIKSIKASPPAVETVFGEPADREARQAKMLGKVMDNETRDALEEVDSAASSLPAELTAPLGDKPEVNLLDRFLSENSQLIARVVDVALASGYRGDHTNGKGVLLKEIHAIGEKLTPEAFAEYRKSTEEVADKEIARQDLKSQELVGTTLSSLHAAFSNLVSGGNSLEAGVPAQGNIPSSDEVRAMLSGLDAELEAKLHSGDLSGVYGQGEPPRASDLAAVSKTLRDLETMYSGSKLKGGATVAKLPNLYTLLLRLIEDTGAGSYRLKMFGGIEAAPISKIDRKPSKQEQQTEPSEERKDLFKKMQTVFGHLSSGDLSLSSRVPKALEIKGALRGLGAAMLSVTAEAVNDLQGHPPEQMKVTDEKTSKALDELRSLYAGGRAHSEEDTRLKVSKVAELLEDLVYKKDGTSYQLLSFPAIKASPSRQDEDQAAPQADEQEDGRTTVADAEAVSAAVTEAEKPADAEDAASAGRQVFTQAIDVTRKRMRAVQDAMARNRDRAVAKRYQMQLDGLTEQVSSLKDGVDKYNEVLAKITELTETVTTLQSTLHSKDTSSLPALLEEVKDLSKTVSAMARETPKDPIQEVSDAQAESRGEGGPDDKKSVMESSRMLSRLAKQLGRVASAMSSGKDHTLPGKLEALQRMAEGASGTLARYSTLPWEWSSEEATKASRALGMLETATDEDLQGVAVDALQILFSTSPEGAMKLRMYPLVVTSGASTLEAMLKGLSSSVEEKLVAPLHGKPKDKPAGTEWEGLAKLRGEIEAGPAASSNLEYLQGPVSAALKEWLDKTDKSTPDRGDVESLLAAIKAANSEPVPGNQLDSLLRLPSVTLSGRVSMQELTEELQSPPTKSGSKRIGIGKYLKAPGRLFQQAETSSQPTPSVTKQKSSPVTEGKKPEADSKSLEMISTIRESLDSKERGTLGRFIRSEEIERPGKGEELRELVLNFLGVVEASPATYEGSLSKVVELVSDKQYEAIADEIERRPGIGKRAAETAPSHDITIKLSWHFFGSGTASPVKATAATGGLEAFKRCARREGSEEFLLLDKAFTTMLKSALNKGPVPFLDRAASTHSALFSMLKAYRTRNEMSKPEFLLNMLDISAAPSSQLHRLDSKEDWEGSAPKVDKSRPTPGGDQMDLFK